MPVVAGHVWFCVGSKAGSSVGSVYGDRFLGSMEPVGNVCLAAGTNGTGS